MTPEQLVAILGLQGELFRQVTDLQKQNSDLQAQVAGLRSNSDMLGNQNAAFVEKVAKLERQVRRLTKRANVSS